MRTPPRLGAVNLALISLYFAPLWGADAMRTLGSPFNGFEDRVHATIAIYVRQLFGLDVDGLIRISNLLGGIKLVVAAGFLAYLIEFMRALATGRDVDRVTLDVVLLLAAGAILIWAVPAFVLDDAALIRLAATHLLLVSSAVFVVVIERQAEAPAVQSRVATAAAERKPGLLEPALAAGLRRDLPGPTYFQSMTRRSS